MDPSAVDRAAIDAFTPFLFFGGMVSRATGQTATRTLFVTSVAEVLTNATVEHTKGLTGAAARREHPLNMLTDIAAGLGGWFLMDWIMRQNQGKR
jgi:hypothetical protein